MVSVKRARDHLVLISTQVPKATLIYLKTSLSIIPIINVLTRVRHRIISYGKSTLNPSVEGVKEAEGEELYQEALLRVSNRQVQ